MRNSSPLSRRVAQYASSSTRFSGNAVRRMAIERAAINKYRSGTGEVSLPTGVCGPVRLSQSRPALESPLGERNESVFARSKAIQISNRKDRQKADLQPLLKTPNAAGMVEFAEGVRHRSAASDEHVMDRGTECVAGGSNAI